MRHAIAAAICAAALTACGSGSRIIIPTGPGTGNPPGGGNNNPPVTPPTLGVTKIMAFGDSLTEGESLGQLLVPTAHNPGTAGVSSSYPAKLLATLTSTYTGQVDALRVYNAGFGGERAVGSIARDRLILMLNTYQPDVLLLLHGVNDVNAGVPLATVAEAIEELIETAQARGVKHVFLGNLPPQKSTAKATGEFLVGPFNQLLSPIAAEEGATLVDIHSAIEPATMLMPDGLHLTEAGNVRIADTFYAAIKAKYHQAPQ